MRNSTVNSTEFDQRFKSKFKAEKNKKNKHTCTRKFAKYNEYFTIFQEKIHWIRSEMASGNAELNGEFNQIRLKIQIEMKTEVKKKKKTTLQ